MTHIVCMIKGSVTSFLDFFKIVWKAALCEFELYSWSSSSSAGLRYSTLEQQDYSISVHTSPYRFWCR